MRKFAVLPLLFAPMIVWGDCTEHLQTWAKSLHPDLEFDQEHAVCKVNPGDANQILAALPIVEKAEEDAATYGLHVLVADAASGKILAHQYQSAAIESDAVWFAGMRLDTARYQIASGLRAFGVRIDHEGSSRYNPYGEETLSLFLYDGTQLREVMSKMVVERSNGEWNEKCVGYSTAVKRSLAIGKPGKEGFASLQLSEKTTDSRYVANGDDCDQVEELSVEASFALEYSDGKYAVPARLSYR